MIQYLDKNKIKRSLFALSIIFILFFGLMYFYNRSYLEIRVQNPEEGQIEYYITNQSTGGTVSTKSDSASIKKMVARGSYEIVVKQKNSNSLSLASTKPLLANTIVDTTLSQEKAREFVGNNPGPCMFYSGILYSSPCESILANLRAHTPADTTTPTTTVAPPEDVGEIPLNSFIEYQNNPLVLLGTTHAEQEEISERLFKLNPDASISGYTSWTSRTPENTKAINYQNGILTYKAGTLTDITYRASPSGEAKLLDIPRVQADNLSAQQLSVSGDKISVSYTNSTRPYDSDDRQKIKNPQTLIQIYDGSDTRTYDFDGIYYTSGVCATNYICLLQDRKLQIYDIRPSKPKKIATITNVYKVIESGMAPEQLRVVRYDGLYLFDVSKLSGYAPMMFGAYQPCGVENASNDQTLLCVINEKEEKAALVVKKDGTSDSIESKVSELLKLPYVLDVSVYKSFIYIVPNLGEPEYRDELKGFGYDPALKKSADQKIKGALQKLGIDSSKYTVINTTP